LCEYAKTDPAPRDFFEKFFRPVLIKDGEPMLFTGYFEPQLPGSRVRGDAYQYPIYGVPDDLVSGEPYFTRREIDEDQPLANRGLELAWLTDPVDLFFLQVQGSGRISLPDGDVMRVGYGGKNGRNYSSIGMALVERGEFERHQVSAAVIRNWVRQNRKEGRALLWENESYVFFREVSEVPADLGPLGAMNRSITQGRSIAVDPAFVTLGSPVWIEKEGAEPMNRLMVAQDTGSAIKGAQRADIFFGTGSDAGSEAGKIKDAGRMVVLLPATMAHRVVAANR
jgi:membrane-bound lytic murein transglycosylase A